MTTGCEARREDICSSIYGALIHCQGKFETVKPLFHRLAVPQRLNTELAYDGNSTFRCIHKRTITCSHQNLYTNVYKSQKVQSTCPSPD